MRYLKLYQTLAEQTADKGNLVKPYVLYTKENKTVTYTPQVIDFKDAITKQWCVDNFDTDKDGELSYSEAKKVKELPNTFPKNATSFDEFQYFTSVTSIADHTFYLCTSLSSITMPNSVTTIGHYVFQDCSSLSSITIPDSVTTIGNSAFRMCSGLTSVIIGSSVKELGYQTFSGCMSITTFKFNGPMDQWRGVLKGYDWHYGFPSTTVVTCTDGTVPLD